VPPPRYRGVVTDAKERAGRWLVLLRHAKSDWAEEGPDHERPLAKRGRKDAPVVGRWLGKSGYNPDAVICSTALRARQTWDLAAQGLLAAIPATAPATAQAPGPTTAPATAPAAGPATGPVVRYEPRVYEATVLALLMLVREFDPAWRTVLLVGHNPGLAELTAGLADPPPGSPLAFPTAAVAVLELQTPWAATAPAEARLLAFTVPADLHA
jgi:phosphohistidine phosphatase